jgi:zinc protease
VYIIDKPGAGQSVVVAAEIAPSAMDKEDDAFTLMNTMLGGSFLSRLNMNLREDKHWTYGAGSGKASVRGPAIFSARAAVQTDKTKESILEMLKELTQIGTAKPIAPDEFANAQKSMVLSLPGDWQTNNGIMGFLLQSILYNRGLDYPGKYPTILADLKITEIQQVANAQVKPDKLTWLIIGDRQKIEAGIRDLKLGPVKILDNDGKEIK